jgi:hypothetical protein
MNLKKTSIALVAALVIGLMGVTSANANTQTLTVSGVSASGGTTSATAVGLPVPGNTVAASNALSISVSGVVSGTTVSATATNAFLLTTLTGATSASGSSAVTVNASTSGSVELFVFTKTTAVGSVVVTIGNTATTYFVKGIAGDVVKVALSAPASGLAGSTQSVVVSAFDQYDNAKPSGTVNLIVNSNGVITTPTATTGDAGTVSYVVTLPSTGSFTITAFAASSSATAIIAVTQPRNFEAELAKALADLAAERLAHDATKALLSSSSAEVSSLSNELAVLKSQIETDKALAAKEVRKLKWQYNTLVKKYNLGKTKSQRLAFVK